MTMTGDLSQVPPCGSCEFCVREAAVLSVANAAAAAAVGLTSDHMHHHQDHHVWFPELDETAALTAAGLAAASNTGTLRSNHHNLYSNFDPDQTASISRSNHHSLPRNLKEPSSSSSSSPSPTKQVQVPLTVCLLLLASYILLGGFMFSRWNPRWTLLDGSFFAFISLTTVGLSASPSSGEALFSPNGSLFQGSNKRLVLCTLYLLVGFALLSMTVQLVYQDVSRRARRMGRGFKRCCSSSSSSSKKNKNPKEAANENDMSDVVVRNTYDLTALDMDGHGS